jgi:tetratricopeptide (TPR) repeat protein
MALAWPGPKAQAEITERHVDVAKKVFAQLLAVMDRPEGWKVWPPEVTVTDPGIPNAYAGYKTVDGVDTPFVEVTADMIADVAKFDPQALAFTLGHELGHLKYLHSFQSRDFQEKYGSKLGVIRMAANREQELEADLFGMKLAFKAGFTRTGMMAELNGWRSSTPPYCRYEGLSLDHPSWEDRAAYLLSDDQQQSLWQSLSAFQTGVMFLENQHFTHAELCFQQVTADFPECYEAWANLGYALLMQYCDALDAQDLKGLDVGHLVVGGFYRRPDSLEPAVRGTDEKLWFEAVGAFREALRLRDRLKLQDELLMVKANLAVAYLVHPGGKDVGQAERWFDEVFKSLKDPEKAKTLDPLVYASILINSGSARGFDDELIESTLKLLAKAKTTRGNGAAVEAMESALSFNQARALASQKSQGAMNNALKLYERYLDGMTACSSWWPLAYEDYARLARSAGAEPKSEDAFRKPGIQNWRPLTGVQLTNGVVLGLSENISQIVAALGPAEAEIPVIEGTNMKFHKYPKLGVSVLATREVLAVILEGEAAPELTIRRPGLGGDEAVIALGMSRAEVEGLIGGEWDVELTQLFDTNQYHQLYRSLGLAVQFKDGVVSELVVSVVPQEDS